MGSIRFLAAHIVGSYSGPCDKFVTSYQGNAFTSAFKELDPVPQFKATAKLAKFLDENQSRFATAAGPS